MATDKALLINVADLRAFTDIGPNYNTRNLVNAVLKAQERDLRDILGKNLLNRFMNDIANGDILPTAYNNLLDEYIKPYLIQVSYGNVLETIYLTPTGSGLGQRSASPSFAPASREVYYSKQETVKQEVDHYGNKLVEYLQYNYSTFTELNTAELASDNPN